MRRSKKQLAASFKGVQFFVRTESQTAGGRRIVLHDYPNSKTRYIEDMGELPPIFKIKAFVHGENYLDNAQRLEAVLKTPGADRLILPNFGSIRVFALPYRKNASQKTVGEIEFDLEFAVGRDLSAPRAGKATIEKVFEQGDEARGALAEAVQVSHDEPTSRENVAVASFDLQEMVNSAFADFKSVVTTTTDLEKQVEAILNNTSAIVRDGVALSNTLVTDRDNKGLWQILSVASDKGRGFVSALKQTVFGGQLSLVLSDIKRATVDTDTGTNETIPVWPETTAGRVKRNKNRLNMVNATRVNALVVAYEQAASATYSTDAEVDEAREALESNYVRLMRVDTDDRDLVQSGSVVRRSVQDLRLSALEVLDSKEQQAFAITSILQNTPISAFELAYEIYAESITTEEELEEKALELRSLNFTLPADKLAGSLAVIEI